MSADFEHARRRLTALAYRLLGSLEEAEDVVQDAWLRAATSGVSPASDAWLATIVTRLAIDRLRRLKLERRSYPGPWLPEPFVERAVEDQDSAQLAEELSIALLLLLERLTPNQRAVFVLREAFGLGYADIAAMLGVSTATCRQWRRRAGMRLGEIDPDQAAMESRTDFSEHRSLLEGFADAMRAGDVARCVELLSADAVALTDGGGVVSAAIIPLRDRQRIAAVFCHIAARAFGPDDPAEIHRLSLNARPALAFVQRGILESLASIETRDGHITRLFVYRNPTKLARAARLLGVATLAGQSSEA